MLTMIGILKVIGIVLLCVTGAVALLLLLVLFMPVRYRIKGEFEKNIPLGQMTAVWHLQHLTACGTDIIPKK